MLRAVSYGESDRVVTLFGRTTGRVSALARGARKSQRRFAGGLGLCSVGDVSVRERAGALALQEEVRYVELSDRGDFNDAFVDQLQFPA